MSSNWQCAEQLHPLSLSDPQAPPAAGTIRRIEYRQSRRQATGISDNRLLELEEDGELPAGRGVGQCAEQLHPLSLSAPCSPAAAVTVRGIEYAEHAAQATGIPDP